MHCPRDVNFSRAAATNVRDTGRDNTQNAVHIVLERLCKELDSSDWAIKDTDDVLDDSKVFEELLEADVAGASSNHENSRVDFELNNSKIFSIHFDSMPASNTFWDA